PGKRDRHLFAGQDRYGVMTRVYYKDAHAAVIVLDAARERTIEGALRWKADLDQKLTLADGSAVPTVLLANKCDLNNDISDSRLSDLERDNGFIGSFRTSAKDDVGISDAFNRLVESVVSTEEGGQYEVPIYGRQDSVRLSIDARSTREHKGSSEWNCCA
ncbi:glo-1, partial [Pristionchus pacificus]|uniref:Glo-1 n=1 Tax=Pristionchus pacificus TaxID=54126 RepID=A0A2A6C608_PRIPA